MVVGLVIDRLTRTPNGVIDEPSMNSLTGIVRDFAWLSTEL